MKLTTAIEGYRLFTSSGNYSPRTIRMYIDNLTRLAAFLGDVEIEAITPQDLQRFMGYMKTDYVPSRFSGSTQPISPAYLDIQWKTIRSFFKWAAGDLDINRPDLKLPRPHYKNPEVDPFSADDIKKILTACEYSKEVIRKGTHNYRIKRKTALRDRVIILALLDTGLRVGELCRMKVEDVDTVTGACLVAPFSTGRKTRPRTVFLGKITLRAVWLYLAKRKDYDKTDPLIPLTEDPIRLLLKGIEERAGIKDVHPHRFRHTFAVMFLKNGGDPFALMRLLGHEDLAMTRRYVNYTRSDLQTSHHGASPVDNWKL